MLAARADRRAERFAPAMFATFLRLCYHFLLVLSRRQKHLVTRLVTVAMPSAGNSTIMKLHSATPFTKWFREYSFFPDMDTCRQENPSWIVGKVSCEAWMHRRHIPEFQSTSFRNTWICTKMSKYVDSSSTFFYCSKQSSPFVYWK